MSELADLLQELLFARDEIAARAWGSAESYRAAQARQERARQQIQEKVQALVEAAKLCRHKLIREIQAHSARDFDPHKDAGVAAVDKALAPFEATDV